MNVITETFLACSRAYKDMGLAPDDFKIPLVKMPVERTIEAMKEQIKPFEQEDLAVRLRSRIEGTEKEAVFEEEVYSVIPSLHQKRLEQITYLKKQIILNELFSELQWAEENLSKLQAIQELDPAAKQLFVDRITALKTRIKEKMDLTGLSP